jgi:hypothetical protein
MYIITRFGELATVFRSGSLDADRGRFASGFGLGMLRLKALKNESAPEQNRTGTHSRNAVRKTFSVVIFPVVLRLPTMISSIPPRMIGTPTALPLGV